MLERLRAFIESTAGAIFLLFFGLCLFTTVCIMVALKMPDNQPIYGLLSGIVGNFNGSLMTLITVRNQKNTDVTGKNSQVTIDQRTEVKKEDTPTGGTLA